MKTLLIVMAVLVISSICYADDAVKVRIKKHVTACTTIDDSIMMDKVRNNELRILEVDLSRIKNCQWLPATSEEYAIKREGDWIQLDLQSVNMKVWVNISWLE